MAPDRGNTVASIAVEERIHLIRAQRAVLAKDVAERYGVTTYRLKKQVRRNEERFPPDFMFQPTIYDVSALRSHHDTSIP
jgi:hypothetical protein